MKFNTRLRKTGCIAFAAALLCAVFAGAAGATPSTTYWTPATTDIQGFGVLHITYDSYFTVFKTGSNKGDFPTDVGLTIGVLPYEKLQMEVGFDLLEPSDDPLFFNAKIGTPEGALFSGSPAINLGIFNVGTETDKNKVRTDQNIGHILFGKTIPVLGRLFAGYYLGNAAVLKNSNGDTKNHGFMVGFDRGFLPTKDKAGNEFNRLVLAADYASGKNSFGGGGVGLYYYFNKDIDLLTGPVWFNDDGINGQWKWTLQLDINHNLF
ncbi:MAG: hypothetical protein HZA60_03820 [Deltaproteobacteria bacterium]|nr:hypothetical protein [Deltaproteobacteria bacterium]